MKAKIIKKGTDVFIKTARGYQGSVIKSGPFMYGKHLCFSVVGFKGPIQLRNMGAM